VAFALLARGVAAILNQDADFSIAARSTVLRENFRCLRETAAAAQTLGLRSISYLAADLTSTAFNRPERWSSERQSEIALSETEVPLLENEIEALISEWGAFGFVREDAAKLRRIAQHYKAHLGLCEAVAPRCNAPWVSAVIEADGTVRPCFFHAPIGRLNGGGLLDVLSAPQAMAFRSGLNIAENPTCRRCVCSLHHVAHVQSTIGSTPAILDAEVVIDQ
jgi:Fe-coproporphyrin III synthase